MQKFIIKLLIFISPLVLFFGWWEHQLARIPNSYSTKIRLIGQAAFDCEVLVLGSSHGYMGINPSYFTQKGFSMANTSQSLYYDTEIVAHYLPRLPKLKCAIFPVSYFSLEGGMLTQGSESFRCPFYCRFYHLPAERWIDNCDIRNFSMVMLYGLTDSVRYLKKWFKVNLTEHLSENGYYENNPDKNHENISDEKGKIRVEFHTAGMTEANIVYNRALLFRAIGLCKNAGVVPFLITTPVYHTYRDHMDHDKYDRMQKVIRDLCEKTGTKYFNYLDDPRFDIDDFSDNDHLNACGAEKFSTILDQEVLRHLEKNAVQNKTCP